MLPILLSIFYMIRFYIKSSIISSEYKFFFLIFLFIGIN